MGFNERRLRGDRSCVRYGPGWSSAVTSSKSPASGLKARVGLKPAIGHERLFRLLYKEAAFQVAAQLGKLSDGLCFVIGQNEFPQLASFGRWRHVGDIIESGTAEQRAQPLETLSKPCPTRNERELAEGFDHFKHDEPSRNSARSACAVCFEASEIIPMQRSRLSLRLLK